MRWLAAVGRASIWHREAIPASEAKYATPLKRVILPAFDIAVMVLGVLGLGTGGFVALRLTLPAHVPCAIYGVIAITGVVCFVGIGFPRLWAVELLGKTLMLGAMLILLGAFLQAGLTVPGHAGVVAAPMVVWGVLILLLRLWIIGVELGKRMRGAAWSG